MRMENQYHIFLIRFLENVEVDLSGVKTLTNFKVIEIMGGIDHYPMILGIDWAYANYDMINLMNITSTFEASNMNVTKPLNPL